MKTWTAIFSLYFLFLLAIPTLKVVKSELGCKNSCCKEQKSEIPKGCQKEKCLFNLSYSTGHFIVQQIQKIVLHDSFATISKNDLSYEKVFIPNYKNSIWHPPKVHTLV
jgi:hypothetical protein